VERKKTKSKIVASTSATPKTPERLAESFGVSRNRDIELDKILHTIGDSSDPQKNIQIAILKKPWRGRQIIAMRFGESTHHARKYFTLQQAVDGATKIYLNWLEGQKDIKSG